MNTRDELIAAGWTPPPTPKTDTEKLLDLQLAVDQAITHLESVPRYDYHANLARNELKIARRAK